MPGTENIRMMALELMLEIMEQGEYSSHALNDMLSVHQFMDKQDRAFLARLVQGSVERCLEIDYVLDQFSKVKTKKMKPVIRNILRISVYQILYMDQVPDSAACNEAVKLAQKKGFHGLTGFVNGILRNISRQKETLPYPPEKDTKRYLSIRYSMPEWIVGRWLSVYGERETKAMLSSQYEERKTSVRRKMDVSEEEFFAAIAADGGKVELSRILPYAYQLSGYNFLEGMKTFQKGWFQVQDVSSMLAVEAAGIRQDMFVLDVCAAPGGKSLLAADIMQGTGTVLARDLTEQKVEKIEENIERLGYQNIKAECRDALVFDPELAEKADVVIADLPCSGLGITGHKNDIKYRVTEESVQELAQLQRKILSVVWQYVKPGGTLVFSTCTVTEEENTKNREWILANTGLTEDSLVPYLPERYANYPSAAEGYVQLRQGIDGTDGFFIARFIRKESTLREA